MGIIIIIMEEEEEAGSVRTSGKQRGMGMGRRSCWEKEMEQEEEWEYGVMEGRVVVC